MKQLIRFVLRHVPRRYIQRVVHLCTPLVGLFYAGSRVQCPVCGNRYRKFMKMRCVRIAWRSSGTD